MKQVINQWINLFKNMSIIWKSVISYILIILVPFIVLFSYFSNLYMHQATQNFSDVLSNQINTAKQGIEKTLSQIEIASEHITKNPSLTDYLQFYSFDPPYYDYYVFRYLSKYLSAITGINPNIHTMHIYPTDSNVPRFQLIMLPSERIQTEPWFPAVNGLLYKQIYWEGLHQERLYTDLTPSSTKKQAQIFSLYRKIYASDNSTEVAILEMNVKSTEIFDTFLNSSTAMDRAFLYIIDANHRIVMQSKNSPIFQFNSETFAYNSQKDPQTISLNKKSYLVNDNTINDLGLRVLSLYPYEQISASTKSRLTSLLIILLSSLTTIFFITYLFSNLIFKRLNTLIKQMKKVQQGHFDIAIKVGASDEIGHLENAFSTMLDKINTLINTVYKTQLAEKEAKLGYLQAQMNPHFLFNSLEALRMVAELENNHRLSDGLYALGSVMKAHIHLQGFTRLEEELGITQSYVMLQNLRYNGKIHFEYEITPGLELLQVPSLSIQPIVENAILHGFRHKSKDCVVLLRVSLSTDGRIEISIMDNGGGFSALPDFSHPSVVPNTAAIQFDSGSSGIALKNIHERLQLYYGNDYGIQIRSLPNTETIVTMLLPPTYPYPSS